MIRTDICVCRWLIPQTEVGQITWWSRGSFCWQGWRLHVSGRLEQEGDSVFKTKFLEEQKPHCVPSSSLRAGLCSASPRDCPVLSCPVPTTQHQQQEHFPSLTWETSFIRGYSSARNGCRSKHWVVSLTCDPWGSVTASIRTGSDTQWVSVLNMIQANSWKPHSVCRQTWTLFSPNTNQISLFHGHFRNSEELLKQVKRYKKHTTEGENPASACQTHNVMQLRDLLQWCP